MLAIPFYQLPKPVVMPPNQPTFGKQETSQIVFNNSLDGSIVTMIDLFCTTMELDDEIEQLRITLAQNPKFYIEQAFTYLKNYHLITENLLKENNNQKKYMSFLDFDFSGFNQTRPVIQNLINSSKDGVIPFRNILKFCDDAIGYETNIESISAIEKMYHTHQQTLGINQVHDTSANQYPFPQDFEMQRQQQMQQIQIQQQQQFGGSNQYSFASQEAELNDGRGFNFNVIYFLFFYYLNKKTFLKMFLSYSIPSAKHQASKKKLIYEPNVNQQSNCYNLDQNVKYSVAQLFRLEIELDYKSESLRVKLAQDQSYNPITNFQVIDIRCDGNVDFSSLEHVMSRTNFILKPKGFSALLRRAQILGGQTRSLLSLDFDSFKVLTQVRSPYFKRPNIGLKEQTSTTLLLSGAKQDTYQVHRVFGGLNDNSSILKPISQMLDMNFEQASAQIDRDGVSRINLSKTNQIGIMNTKMRTINLDDPNAGQAKKAQTPHRQHMNDTYNVQQPSQANIPIYNSNNLNVTQILKHTVNDKTQQQRQADIMAHTTKQNWNDNQFRGVSQGPKTQREQQIPQEQPLVRPSTNFDNIPGQQARGSLPMSGSQVDSIVGESYQLTNAQRFQQQLSGKETYNAQHANTSFYDLQNQQRGGIVAPWQKTDKKTEQNVRFLNNQQNEIQNLSGFQPPIRPAQPAQPAQSTVSPQQPTPQPILRKPEMAGRQSARIFGNSTHTQNLQFPGTSGNMINQNFDSRSQIQPHPDRR